MKIGVLITLMMFLILSAGINKAEACEFEFKVTSGETTKFKMGDEIIVTVTLILTHRNCPEATDLTKFDFVGLKALGATSWKQTGEGKYERKFKLQVIDETKGRHILNAKRTCDKDGGVGSFKIDVS